MSPSIPLGPSHPSQTVDAPHARLIRPAPFVLCATALCCHLFFLSLPYFYPAPSRLTSDGLPLSMTPSESADSSYGTARSEPNAASSCTWPAPRCRPFVIVLTCRSPASQLAGAETLPELRARIKAGLRTYPDFPKVRPKHHSQA